jgi:hypothetical protein
MDFQDIYIEEEEGFAGDLRKKRMDFQDIYEEEGPPEELHRRRRDFLGTYIRRGWFSRTSA